MTETLTADWIAEKLREHRIQQKDLARAMGIAPSGVTRLLRGERRLRPREVASVLQFFARYIREVPTSYDPRPPAGVSARKTPPDGNPSVVPVYSGLAERLAGDAPAEWREPPASLRAAHQIFGIFVDTDGDAPLLLAGDVAYIHPGRPARNGVRVIVEGVGVGLLRRTGEGRLIEAGGKTRPLSTKDRILVIAAIESA